MKKTFIINGCEVEFTACTAIAASIGSTDRQKAVFIHARKDVFHDGDGIIFGIDVPENAEEAKSALCESVDTYQETLNTVQFESEKEV